MSSLNDEIPLAALSIPGVHDAATASVTAWTQWTRTQDLDIATLWSYGVRAFDLRPAWVDGTMGIYHDKYSAHISFPEVLSILLWELTGSGLCSAAGGLRIPLSSGGFLTNGRASGALRSPRSLLCMQCGARKRAFLRHTAYIKASQPKLRCLFVRGA